MDTFIRRSKDQTGYTGSRTQPPSYRSVYASSYTPLSVETSPLYGFDQRILAFNQNRMQRHGKEYDDDRPEMDRPHTYRDDYEREEPRQRDPAPPMSYREDYGQRPRDQQRRDDMDTSPVFCYQCYGANRFVNRLACGHLYCDSCMQQLDQQQNPSRRYDGSFQLHYVCPLDHCRKSTDKRNVTRLTPSGAKEDVFRDVRYH